MTRAKTRTWVWMARGRARVHVTASRENSLLFAFPSQTTRQDCTFTSIPVITVSPFSTLLLICLDFLFHYSICFVNIHLPFWSMHEILFDLCEMVCACVFHCHSVLLYIVFGFFFVLPTNNKFDIIIQILQHLLYHLSGRDVLQYTYLTQSTDFKVSSCIYSRIALLTFCAHTIFVCLFTS